MESEVNQAPAKKAMAPNILVLLILGILSLNTSCFVGGLFVGIVGLILSILGTKKFNLDPERYNGGSMLKAGKVMSIIGIVLSGISLIIILVCDGNALAVVDMIEDEL